MCKQKTAYELRISDWSSDVCSSDLGQPGSGCKWRCSVRIPKGKNAAECGYKGQRLIEHQMVTGFRHRDDRTVTSTQLANVFGRSRGEEFAHTAAHDGLPPRCLHQTTAHREPRLGPASSPPHLRLKIPRP